MCLTLHNVADDMAPYEPLPQPLPLTHIGALQPHLLCDARDGLVISGQPVDQRKKVEALCQRLVACAAARAVTVAIQGL